MRLIAGLFVLTVCSHPVWGITLGQVDTFQTGAQGWRAGGSGGVVPGGGPAGASDPFFQTSSDPYGYLTANGGYAWVGGVDYVTPGVKAISADLRNFGASTLAIRLFLYNGRANGSYTSTDAFSLPNDGQWHHAIFGLTASELTWVGSGVQGKLDGTLMQVKDLALWHQSGPPQPSFTPTAGSFGIDNITALPEPSSFSAVLLAGVCSVIRRRRRASWRTEEHNT